MKCLQESAEEDGLEQQLHAQIDNLSGQLSAKDTAHRKEMTEKITAISALNGVVKVRGPLGTCLALNHTTDSDCLPISR